MIIGKASAPAWLNTRLVLNHYSSRTTDAKKHFVEFVKAGTKQGQIWDNLRQQIYLGDKTFIESVHLKSGLDAELPEIPRIQARKPGLSIDAYVAQTGNRNEAIREAYKSGIYTQKELSDHFGLHYSTVSKILR